MGELTRPLTGFKGPEEPKGRGKGRERKRKRLGRRGARKEGRKIGEKRREEFLTFKELPPLMPCRKANPHSFNRNFLNTSA